MQGVPVPAGEFLEPGSRSDWTPPSDPCADFAFDSRLAFRVVPARMALRAPATPPNAARAAASPQPLLALLRGELVEGLRVLLAQKGLVVVLEALVVLGRPLAQLRVGPHHALLAHCGLGPQRSGSEHPRQQQPQGKSQEAVAATAYHCGEERAARRETPSEQPEREATGGMGPGAAAGKGTGQPLSQRPPRA